MFSGLTHVKPKQYRSQKRYRFCAQVPECSTASRPLLERTPPEEPTTALDHRRTADAHGTGPGTPRSAHPTTPGPGPDNSPDPDKPRPGGKKPRPAPLTHKAPQGRRRYKPSHTF